MKAKMILTGLFLLLVACSMAYSMTPWLDTETSVTASCKAIPCPPAPGHPGYIATYPVSLDCCCKVGTDPPVIHCW